MAGVVGLELPEFSLCEAADACSGGRVLVGNAVCVRFFLGNVGRDLKSESEWGLFGFMLVRACVLKSGRIYLPVPVVDTRRDFVILHGLQVRGDTELGG